MDTQCRIELLGGLRVVQGERVITRFRTNKAASLLAYLACHLHQNHPRERLIELLWPEVEPKAGRNRLRMALSFLRHPLEPPGIPAGAILKADRTSVSLNPLALATDVMEFETALKRAASAGSNDERVQHLTTAVELYRGELLSGFYDDWVQTEQQRLAERFFQAMRQLIASCVKPDDLDTAINYALRAVSIDPLREESHSDLIRLYATADRPAEALRQYEELERLLREQLGVGPCAETRELGKTLLREAGPQPSGATDRKTRQQRKRAAGIRRSAFSVKSLAERTTGEEGKAPPNSLTLNAQHSTLRPSLPLQFTRFFGREEELGVLGRWCVGNADDPPHPLITLTGPGGTGKTRLAIEVAGRLAQTFTGGIWFVPLQDLSDPRLILGTVLDAQRLPRSPQAEPLDQVVEFLNSRASATLLVLDNMEQLLEAERRKAEDGAAVVRALLDRCPSLTCLVTSRQSLALEGEQELCVPPLPVPGGVQATGPPIPERPNPRSPEELMRFASVQLFVDRAQSGKPDFQVTTGNAAAIAQLCDRLEGIPLALALAAGRAQVMTPKQMLSELEHRFEFLISRRRDATERHRTLWAAIEWSYRLLSPELRRFFTKLSVFRGGWSVEAAAAVCEVGAQEGVGSGTGMALDSLAQLRECSLVLPEEQEGEIRFRMLETLREFAWGQMSQEERDAARQRHLDFFLRLAEAAEPHLIGAEQGTWMDQLEVEHDNLRSALRRCQEIGETGTEWGLTLCGALWRFWSMRRYVSEGRERVAGALSGAGSDARTLRRSRALIGAGSLAQSEGDYPSAQAFFEESLSISREIGDRGAIANSLNGLGRVASCQGDYSSAQSFYEESLSISQVIGNRRGIAVSLLGLGRVASCQGDYPSAQSFYEESLAIHREIGDRGGIANSLNGLGNVAPDMLDYPAARAFYEESLAISREIGDRGSIATSLHNLGFVARKEGDYPSAWTYYEQSLSIYREIGELRGLCTALNNLGNVASDMLDYPAARAFYEESLAINREIGDRRGIAYSLNNLGIEAQREGDYPSARALYEESLSIKHAIGNREGIASSLEEFAALASVQERSEQAARLWSAAEALREEIGSKLPPSERKEYDHKVAETQAKLGKETFAAEWAMGRQMSLEQVIAYALEVPRA